ncbi:hypothetical protein D3C73_658850 [compost metagenome]
MFQVIFHLLVSTTIGLVYRNTHAIGHFIRIHDYFSLIISGGTTNRLDKRSFGTQKAFLICIENSNKRDLR